MTQQLEHTDLIYLKPNVQTLNTSILILIQQQKKHNKFHIENTAYLLFHKSY